jgi:hypothetical protein
MNIKELCRLLSEYCDHDLSTDICREVDRVISSDCECRSLYNTFRETIQLCHQVEEVEVPRRVHIRLYQTLHIKIRKRYR